MHNVVVMTENNLVFLFALWWNDDKQQQYSSQLWLYKKGSLKSCHRRKYVDYIRSLLFHDDE